MARRAVADGVELAWIGEDGHLHVGEASGGRARRLSWSPEDFGPLPGLAGPGVDPALTTPLAFSHPTWAPDGSRLAVLAAPRDTPSRGTPRGEPAWHRVYVLDATGVEVVDAARYDGGAPIYLAFGDDGAVLRVLVQHGERLRLDEVRFDPIGEPRTAVSGGPLFFNQGPGSGAPLCMHVDGDAREEHSARVVLRPPGGGGERLVWSSPGYFCTPAWSPDGRRIAGTEVAGPGVDRLVVADLDSGSVRPYGTWRGLVTVAFAPEGDTLAVAASPSGGGAPYQRLDVVRLADGERVHQIEDHLLAFAWLPGGRRIVYAGVDMWSSCLWWYVLDLDSGARTQLSGFLPSRPQLFALNFFDQYAASHPFLDPTGTRIVFAGRPAGGPRGTADDGPSKVFVAELTPGAHPVEVSEGVFAAWRPPASD